MLAKSIPNNLKYFAYSAVAGLAIAFAVHLFFNQKESTVQIIASSHIDASSAFAPIETEGKSANDSGAKVDIKSISIWLRSFDFMEAFFKSHCTSVNARAYCPQFFPDEERAALALLRTVDSRIEDGKILHVRARASDRETAAQLAGDLGRALVRRGADHAKADAVRIERQLGAKRTEIETRIRSAVQALSKPGMKGGPTLYSNPEKQFAFLSDLQAKAFEIDLRLAESQRAIAILREQGSDGDSDYGPALKIRRIRAENKLLLTTKKSIEKQIKDTVAQHAGGLKGGLAQVQERLRIDMDTLASVSKAIERIRLLASVQEADIEILQQASPLMAKDRWPMLLLLALGLFLSQLFTAIGFVLFELWKKEDEANHGAELPAGAFYGSGGTNKIRVKPRAPEREHVRRETAYLRPKSDSSSYSMDLPN